MTNRRAFLTGLGSIIWAPAIVRASSLMGLPRPERIVLNDPRPWYGIEFATSEEYRAMLVRRWQFSQWVMGKNVTAEVLAP